MADTLDPGALDVGYLALFTGYGFADRVMDELAAHGFGDLRFSHGFVIQHLVETERTIGELAERMEITQQGASKAVAELEGLGYLERTSDPGDARVRRIRLSARGRAAVAATRRLRAQLERRLSSKVGAEAFAAARGVLARLLAELGGAEAVRRRRVQPPR